MSLKITHKYSTAAGTPPASGDIDVGEIAINAADAALYLKDTNGDIKNAVTDALFAQAGASAVQRTVQSKLQDVVSVKDFGAVGDGVTDDTAAIQAALSTNAQGVYFPDGTYRIVNANNTSTATLTSSTDNRTIYGPGRITATGQVKKLLEISGDNCKIHINVDGNNCIGEAVVSTGKNTTISHCNIQDLNGFNNWTAIAIQAVLGSADSAVLIANNTIKNIQAVGDGIGGNGVGFCRGILVSSDIACESTSVIIGNRIEQVEGEEGDSIVIAGGTSAAPLNIPTLITGNSCNGWNRRAVKISGNDITVHGNKFTNDLAVDPGSLQRVVDAISGSRIKIVGNVFSRCKYQAQIAIYLDSPQTGDDYIVSGNIIEGIGSTVVSSLIAIRPYGSTVNISGNVFDCPTHAAATISILEASDVLVNGNTINVNTAAWYSFTNCSNARLSSNITSSDSAYDSHFNVDDSEYVLASRYVTLRQLDTVLSDGEIASSIRCRQYETANPGGINASVSFVAEGSAGSLGVAIATGADNSEKLRVQSNGIVRPAADNTQALGRSDFRWSQVYAGTGTINTSDGNEKQDVRNLLASEARVAQVIKGLIKVFRYKQAYESKGDEARLHVGVIAQDVEQAFIAEGLDPERYGLFCKDKWYEVNGDAITLEEGRSIPSGAVERERLGIRYDELMAFVVSAL